MEDIEKIAQNLEQHLSDEGLHSIDSRITTILTNRKYTAVVEEVLRRKWDSIPTIPLRKKDIQRLNEIKKTAFNRHGQQVSFNKPFRVIVNMLAAGAVAAGLIYFFFNLTPFQEPTTPSIVVETVPAPIKSLQDQNIVLPVKSAAPQIVQQGSNINTEQPVVSEPIIQNELTLEPIAQLSYPNLHIKEATLAQVEISQQPRQIVVSEGSTQEFLMEDGSAIKILGGSTLKVLSSPDSPERRVALSGKANFEVYHDPQRPFIVETRSITVQVLGTSFDLSATPSENVDRIRLKKGSVEIHIGELCYRLKPGETLTYDRKTLGLNIQ